MSGHGDALTETLAFAVPMWIEEVRGLSPAQRQEAAGRAAKVIAAQGDTLMFGSKRAFGHGAREMAAHEGHGRVTAANEDELIRKCRVCATGQASYSAGEIFNELAKGLAVLAFQRGGVRFRDLSWCAAHPGERWTDVAICPACLSEERAAPRGPGAGHYAEDPAEVPPRAVERVEVAGGLL